MGCYEGDVVVHSVVLPTQSIARLYAAYSLVSQSCDSQALDS